MRIFEYIKYKVDSVKLFISKAKDYDRLAHDYSKVICHATDDTLSYTTYDPDFVCQSIDYNQENKYREWIGNDIKRIIENGGTIEDIKEYFETF